MIDRKLALASLFHPGLAPAQGSNDYPFGTLAANNFDTPFTWDISGIGDSDLRPGVDVVEDQAIKNKCVGEAWTTVLEVFARHLGMQMPELSADQVYYIARALAAAATHMPIEDAGTSAWTAAAAMNAQGVCLESLWPDTVPVNAPPDAAAVADALTRPLVRYERLGKTYPLTSGIPPRDAGADILVALECGYPVVVCLPLSARFFDITGPVESHPAQGGLSFINAADYVGSHAMAAIAKRRLADGSWLIILQNSWTAQWGDGGFYGIRLSDLVNRGFDLFTVRAFAGIEGPAIPWRFYRFNAECILRDGRWVTVDFNGKPGQVYRLYQAAFARVPDEGGLGYWIRAARDHGIAILDIAATFAASAEFQSLYPNLTDDGFVRQLYRNVLGREGDEGGIAYWDGVLAAGHSRGEVLQAFADSPENRSRIDPVIANGVAYL